MGLTEAVANINCLDDLIDITTGCSLYQIRSFIDSIRAARGQLKLNANPRLVLEVLMLSIPQVERRGEGVPAAQVR